MGSIFEVGTLHYTHPIVVIIASSPRFLEYIQFVMGMHLQGHWGSLGTAEYEASDRGLIAGTSASSEYEFVEEFEPFGGSLIIITDFELEITVVDMSEGH